jgi:hypothetical protein
MCSVSRLRTGSVRGTKVCFAEILLAQSDLKFLNCKFEARHPGCLGSITTDFVYYTYSRTQNYFV